MQIWLDTINLEAVADAFQMGMLSGVTTNPSILSKAERIPETLSALLDLQSGPVAVQVIAEDVENILSEAREIYSFSNRLIVKIPVNRNGLIAIRELSRENIPVLGTAVFHPTQALLAAKQGAAYIAPYFSHIKTTDDARLRLQQMVTLLQNYPTKILVASLRSIEDVVACALLDVHSVTIKEDLFDELISGHHLLDTFTDKFLSDWKSTKGNSSIKDFLSAVT